MRNVPAKRPPVQQRHRHPRAVRRRGPDPCRGVVGGIEVGNLGHLANRARARDEIVVVHRGRRPRRAVGEAQDAASGTRGSRPARRRAPSPATPRRRSDRPSLPRAAARESAGVRRLSGRAPGGARTRPCLRSSAESLAGTSTVQRDASVAPAGTRITLKLTAPSLVRTRKSSPWCSAVYSMPSRRGSRMRQAAVGWSAGR